MNFMKFTRKQVSRAVKYHGIYETPIFMIVTAHVETDFMKIHYGK